MSDFRCWGSVSSERQVRRQPRRQWRRIGGRFWRERSRPQRILQDHEARRQALDSRHPAAACPKVTMQQAFTCKASCTSHCTVLWPEPRYPIITDIPWHCTSAFFSARLCTSVARSHHESQVRNANHDTSPQCESRHKSAMRITTQVHNANHDTSPLHALNSPVPSSITTPASSAASSSPGAVGGPH